jgi:hypothetical protein
MRIPSGMTFTEGKINLTLTPALHKFGESDIEIGEGVARIPAAMPLEKSGGFTWCISS